MFSIFRVAINSIIFKTQHWKIKKNLVKILFIAPFKSIIKEKVIYFEKSFSFLGLKTIELTGDSVIKKKEFELNNIIIGTPEKIDLFTREKNNNTFFSQIKLVIVDEIHLLNEDRGPILEQIILRFLSNFSYYNKDCRIIGLSATLPNYQDLGQFIHVNPFKSIFYFSEKYREISTNYILSGFKSKKTCNSKSDILNQILWIKILKIIENNSYYKLIIFVHSRKDTIKTGIFILKNLNKYSIELTFKKNLKKNFNYNLIFELKDQISKLLSAKGIGIHHAGLSSKDKLISENLFLLGITPIIISTSTLSWGVNLPATHVIIKGAKIYSPYKTYWAQLSNLNIIQMLGRIARINIKVQHEGILITSYKYFSYYEKLFAQKKAIESKLVTVLPDSFNIECSRFTITNFLTAKIWIINSFFWIRLNRILIKRRCKKYKNSTKEIAYLLNDLLVLQTINQLNSAGMIKYNKNKKTIINTDLGYIASKYGINYQTIMIVIEKLSPYLNQSELIRIFTFSFECSCLFIRNEEKEELKKLASICIFPIKENFDTILFKVNVLFQSYIFNFRLKNFSLSADLVYIGKFSGRYFRSLFEISLNKRWASLTFNILQIYHFIKNRLFFNQKNSSCTLNHFLMAKNFIFIKKNKIKSSYTNSFFKPSKMIISKQKYCKIKNLNSFIKFFFLDLSLHLQPITRNTIKISIFSKKNKNIKKKYEFKKLGIWIFIEDQLSDLIITYQYKQIGKKIKKVENIITTFLPIFDNPFSPYFHVKLIVDNIMEHIYYLPIDFTKINFPTNYPLLTEFLGLNNNFSFRIFAGFQSGNIFYEYFLSNFLILPVSVNQNVNFMIRNTTNKAFFLPVNVCKEIYSELTSIPFLFSKKKYNLLFIFIGNESINLKSGKLRRNSFGALGISVEVIKIQYPGIVEHISNNKSIFISGLLEAMYLKYIFKKSLYSCFTYIIECFYLMGNINFTNQIEFFFNNIRYWFPILSDNRLISISFFFLNNFNVIRWCVVKFLILSSLCKKKILKLKSFIKKIKAKNSQDFKNKNFIKLCSIKMQNFCKKKNLKIKNVIIIGNNYNCLKNHLIEFIDSFIPLNVCEIKFKSKILSKKIMLKKINKLFLYLNFAIIKEADTFNERRITEELFYQNNIKIICLTVGIFSVTSSEKLNSKICLMLNYHSKIIQINSIIGYLFPFFNRINFFILFLTKKNFTLCIYYFRELVVESKLNKSFKENLLTLVVNLGIVNFFSINQYFNSTFLFLRINDNPDYYGFKCNFLIEHIFKKIINPILVKLWFYNYIGINKHFKIKTYNKGMLVVYYSFKEKKIRNILFKKKKKLKLINVTKSLVYIEEISFFLANKKFISKSLKNRNKEKYIQKILSKFHFLDKLKNIYKSALVTIKKIFNFWIRIIENDLYLKNFFFLLELHRLINSQSIKYQSDFLCIPEINKFAVFLLGKIHKIYFYKCLQSIDVTFSDIKGIKVNTYKYLSQKIHKTNSFNFLYLKLFFVKNYKFFKFILNYPKNLNLILFSKYFFKPIINSVFNRNLFYIIIGNIYLNKLIFWKKFPLPDNTFVYFDINLKKYIDKLNIFVFNDIFCCLDRKFEIISIN